jgi:hypothetical protein
MNVMLGYPNKIQFEQSCTLNFIAPSPRVGSLRWGWVSFGWDEKKYCKYYESLLWNSSITCSHASDAAWAL